MKKLMLVSALLCGTFAMAEEGGTTAPTAAPVAQPAAKEVAKTAKSEGGVDCSKKNSKRKAECLKKHSEHPAN